MKPKLKTAPLLLILLLLSVEGAAAQTPTAVLTVGSGSGYPGDMGISVPVSLDPQGAQVSALNFDIIFDESLVEVSGVTIGSASSAAGKTIGWSLPYIDTVRVAIYGANQNLISVGVVANVIFNVKVGAAPIVDSTLELTQVVVSDPAAQSIPNVPNNGTFTVYALPTSTSTSTPTNTPTVTQTPTITRTPTITQTPTITRTPSITPTPTITKTPGPTATSTKTYTPGPSPTITRTPTSSLTPTPDLTSSPTATASPSPTFDSKGGALSEIELAVAATSTALAEFEAAVAGTATALAPPVSEAAASVETAAGSSNWLSQWWDVLLLGGVVLGVIFGVAGWRIIVARRKQAAEAEEQEPDLLDRRLG